MTVKLTAFKVFLPKSIVNAVTPDLAQFGEEVLSKRILDWVTDAERNEPYVRGGGRDAFGRRTSELVVSEGWKNLQNFGIEHGYVDVENYVMRLPLTKLLGSLQQATRESTRRRAALSSF